MRRVLLKLSGEALAPSEPDSGGFGIDPGILEGLAGEMADLLHAGGQLAVVLGGGNLFRGAALETAGTDRITGDHMGMLATIMNGLAVRDVLRRRGLPVSLFSALPVPGVVDGYTRDAAVAAMEAGRIALFVAGTGNPLFTTDTAACLRAIEVRADAVLKATKVDGVYNADPLKDPDAKRFDMLTFDEALARRLGVMDLTAICLCRDHHMPVVVFDMHTKGALTAIINGDKVGTRIVAR